MSRVQMRKKKDAVHGETQGSLAWHEVIDEVSRAFWGKKRNLDFILVAAGSHKEEQQDPSYIFS